MIMTPTHIRYGRSVMLVRIFEGVTINTPPTKIMSMGITTNENLRIPPPRYLPIVSGRLMPSLRNEMTPATKSCIAPIKIPPSVIHRKATGP